MSGDMWMFVAFIAIYFVLMKWVFPRLGVPT